MRIHKQISGVCYVVLNAIWVTLFFFNIVTAQTIYVPTNDAIYDFLERAHLRSLSTYSEAVTPVSRLLIAKYLKEISEQFYHLTKTEQDELAYFKQEYHQELLQIGEKNLSEQDRWRLLQYRDSLFRLDLNPKVGGILAKDVIHRWYGIDFIGSITSSLGYSFHFKDNIENGSNITTDTRFTSIPKKNVTLHPDANTINYDKTTTSLTLDFSWLRIGVAQDNVEWGSGYRGKLILSSKPSPFPFLRMEFRPTNWLHFYYIHGWLKSNILDTLKSYDTQVSGMPRNVYHDKYIAAHLIDLKLSTNWEVAFGESIVYSDMGPQLIFLIPINFFRSADHYLTSHGIGDGNNSQFFADVQYWGLRNIKLYGTIFIDEIDLDNIFNVNRSRNQVGGTLGMRLIGLPTPDVDIRFEYTRIMPWIYSNFAQTQTYENDGELLGHYLGDNCDQIFIEVQWRLSSSLRVNGYLDYVRKGGRTDVTRQYELPSLPFLYGEVSHRFLKNISIEYRLLRDLTIKGDATVGDIQYSGENSNWKLTFQYGSY